MSAATSAISDTGSLQIRLDRLFVPDNNIREYDEEWVQSLRRSIRARGKVLEAVKVIDADPAVHGNGFDHVLIVGFHRERAARLEGLEMIPGSYGDPEEQDTDRAIENIMKKRLNPYQEATAVKKMLDSGKTVAGIAEVLDWDQRRVTARVKLLELPERAQQLVGNGTIALSAVEAMRTITHANPALLETLLDFMREYEREGQGELEVDDLATRPLELLALAVEDSESDEVFLAALSAVPVQQIDALQLDEQTLALIDEATKLNHQLLGWFQPPQFRFSEAEVDRARAAGVLLEYGQEAPLVTDFALYQELCATAIAHGTEALRDRISEREEEAAADKAEQPNTPTGTQESEPDELSELERAHRAAMRSFAASAHAANLDLGDSLRHGLSVIDPSDIKVARFFVYALLGADTTNSYNLDNPVSAIALRGIRLVISDFREDVTKTKQDGSAGVLRITYGEGREHTEQAHWLWKYLDGARTAGDLYGRALVVIAAEHYASRLVLPASQQHKPLRWPSHKDTSVKVLEKLAGPHIAPQLKALERAIAKAKAEYDADSRQIIEGQDDTSEAERPPAKASSVGDQGGPDASGEPAPNGEIELAPAGTLAAGLDELATESGSSGEPSTQTAGADTSNGEPACVDEQAAAIASPDATVGSVLDGRDGCVIDASDQIDF
jgi:hypothetical protein